MRTPLNNCFYAAPLACFIAGCTTWASVVGTPAHEHLEFLARATGAGPAARETMWRDNEVDGSTQESVLRRALLLSIPGSARYNPAKAETDLHALLAAKPPAAVASVARVRLEALQSSGECRQQMDVLKQRLSKVADIERGTDEPVTREPGNPE